MKRPLALLTTAALLASPLAAEAAPKKKPAAPKKTTRTVTYNYTGTLAVTIGGVYDDALIGPFCALPRCWDFKTLRGEQTVTITAKDMTGTPIGLQAARDGDYPGTVKSACGTISLKVSPKTGHMITVYPAVSTDCKALPTQGTLTAVITNF